MIRTLKNSEIAILKLRSLYESRGYQHFKMSKFEEYDIYAENKDFLAGERIITFTDAGGKLLALKPDVTMSIIKNSKDSDNGIERFYYNENVYRVLPSSHQLTEMMQSGLECMGNIDLYLTCEVISLAAGSLKLFEKPYVIDISHMGIVSGLVDELGLSDSVKKDLLKCIGAKNTHEIKSLLGSAGDKLIALLGIDSDPARALPVLEGICTSSAQKAALSELCDIIDVLKGSDIYPALRLDFSVVQDLTYYNGVVFQGFIMGIPEKILTGGRYDLLMKRMGKFKGAIGFAINVDMLERISETNSNYDADVAIIYKSGDSVKAINELCLKLTEEGERVCVVRSVSEKAKYKKVIHFESGEV